MTTAIRHALVVTLTIPSGAFARETEVRVVESAPRDGALARVSIEPTGLALAGTAFECDDGVCQAHQEDDPATHDAGADQGGTTTTQPADDKGNDGVGHG